MSVGRSPLAPAAARAGVRPRTHRASAFASRGGRQFRFVDASSVAAPSPAMRRRAAAPPPARAPLFGPRRGLLAAAFAPTRRLVPGRESAVSAVDPERAGAGAESAVVVADPAPDPAASTAPLDVLPPPAVERDSRTGATPDGGLAFDPARAAAAPARPPAATPAEGQTEESHLAAMTSDDILCQLYGVDQDKEDAQYKVAFFDADAVLEAEALDRLLTEEGLFSSPSKKSFEDEPKSETSRARPDENETRRNGSGLLDGVRLFLAALRAALLAALAYIRGAFARTEDAADPASVSAALKDSNPGPAVRGIRPSRERAAYPSFAGASTDPDALAAAALDAHEAFVRDAVFPEALRYAKQLRYDGYKIVLVTAAPAEALKPLGRAMGASRVIGAEAGSDLATTPDGLAFTGDVEATSALRADRTGCVDDTTALLTFSGEEKARRVRAFAEEVGVSLADSVAYGRAGGRCEALMRCVGKAYAVSPDEDLRRVAALEGWGVLDWAERKAKAAAEGEGRRRGEEDKARGGLPPRGLPPSTTPKHAASRGWTMVDPDQYDPENAGRSR